MAKKTKQEKKAAEPEVDNSDQEEVEETPKKRKQTETKSSGKADKASSKTAKTDEKPAKKADQKVDKKAEAKPEKKVEAKADKKGEKKTDKKADAKSSKKSKKEPEPEEESSADEEQEDQQMEEAGQDEDNENGEQEETKKPAKKAKTDDSESGEVFLSNVSDSVEDSDIHTLFEGLGVTNIKWLNNNTTGAFAGKGFVKLSDVAQALKLSGTEVKGQEVQITLPKNQANSGGNAAADAVTVFVGNLPFTIDDDGIREHFKDCGDIKDVRWGMRDGEFKGFGHIEFATTEGAQKALELAGSDLGGRQIRVDASAPRYSNQMGSGNNRRGSGFGGRGGSGGRGGRGGFGGRGGSGGRGGAGGRGGRGGFGGRGGSGGRGGAQGKRTTF